MLWEVKHTVVADAPREKVWEFHATIENAARIEGDAVKFTLDGPYQTGTTGTTTMPGQDPTHWRLTDVELPLRSVIEMNLAEAVMRFTWMFRGPARQPDASEATHRA